MKINIINALFAPTKRSRSTFPSPFHTVSHGSGKCSVSNPAIKSFTFIKSGWKPKQPSLRFWPLVPSGSQARGKNGEKNNESYTPHYETQRHLTWDPSCSVNAPRRSNTAPLLLNVDFRSNPEAIRRKFVNTVFLVTLPGLRLYSSLSWWHFPVKTLVFSVLCL